MTRHTFVLLCSLAVIGWTSAPVQAQETDFSGTWTLDRDASALPQGRGGGGFGGGGRGGGAPGGGGRGGFGGVGAAPTVVITQTGTELVMEQQAGSSSRTVTYYLDGSESNSDGPRGGSIATTSTWNSAALVTEGAQTMSTPRGDFTIDIRERRTLSMDGQTMTVESTRTTPRGDIAMTLVYRKSS